MSAPRICASYLPRTREELAAVRLADSMADLLEIRLDAIRPPVEVAEVCELLAGFELPVIATCRCGDEGGSWSGDEGTRQAVLLAALNCNVEAVDVELGAACLGQAMNRDFERVIVSRHLLEGLDGLDSARGALIDLAPYRAKLVGGIAAPDEAQALLEAGASLRAAGIRSLAFPMGEWSGGGRLLAAIDDDWIYAAGAAGETAAGQWTAAELRNGFSVPRWQPRGARFAVVGDPLGHSLSPTVFNAAFSSAGLPHLYASLPGSEFASVIALAESAAFDGLSVTMPFKDAALGLADGASATAVEVGAANTLRRLDGGWEAHNTDVEGVVGALGGVLELRGARALVLGAGGAARAAVVGLSASGAEVTVLARDLARASDALGDLRCHIAPLSDFAPGAQLIVNATPVGMEATDESPVPTADLKGDEVVLDMIYRPQWTELLRGARARGCRIVGGVEMFLAQAAAQYRWWLGADAPVEVMRAAANRRIQGEQGG